MAVPTAPPMAHQERVVHRDITPANLLPPISGSSIAKLENFGISCFAWGGA